MDTKRIQIQKSQTKELIELQNLELVHNDSFYHVLKYIYTGKLILNSQNIDRIFDLMTIAKTLELASFSEEISLLLIQALNIENIARIYEKANIYDQRNLKSYCESFIDHNADILLTQKSLVKLPSQCLKEIISRDSMAIIEIRLLELVKDWHEYHNRTNDVDVELIDAIRFELIPNGKLIKLVDCFKLFKQHKVFEIIKQRIAQENSIKPITLRNKLASVSDSNSILILDVYSGQCIQTLDGHSNSIMALEVISNNKLASGSADRSIKIWEVISSECVQTLTGHSSWVMSLKLLNNNKLASGSADNSIKIWNLTPANAFEH